MFRTQYDIYVRVISQLTYTLKQNIYSCNLFLTSLILLILTWGLEFLSPLRAAVTGYTYLYEYIQLISNAYNLTKKVNVNV